jgi:3-oxoacyl-[acyl-carrier protein] reductase
MATLNNKIAVVTGGSRGIGAAIAKRLGAEGATVVVNYARSGKAADSVVESIKEAGGEGQAIQADISKPGEVRTFIEAVAGQYGRIDILVNNAGIAEFSPLEGVGEDHISRQFDLNVSGLLLTTRAAAAHFPATGGSVINISSVVSTRPLPNASAYSATKAAVDAITKSLARELGARNIRVNSVSPGPVETEMMASVADEATINHFLSRLSIARLGQPEDIANAVAFIASDEATWITGQSLGVDGGIIA